MRVQGGSADAPVEAEDGLEAVRLGWQASVDVAVLDLNMPRMTRVEAALKLGALQPCARIALHSSDPVVLRRYAAALGLPLFDKVDFDRLREWVELQATEARTTGGSGRVAPMARKLDLCCSACGYGIVCRTPPQRCPMCGGNAGWSQPRGAMARRAARDERLAG